MSKRAAKASLKRKQDARAALDLPKIPWFQQAMYLSGFADGWNANARRKKP